MRPIISIIIPTYNSGKFISKALDSILDQTFKEYEVIIIDAGSQDKTKEICENYDERFVFEELTGSNQGEARNLGIDKSKSELLMFLDSDDMFADNNVLIDCIKETSLTDSDFYNFSASFIKNKEVIKNIYVNTERNINSRDEILSLGLYGKDIHTVPWNKIYKKDFLKGNGIIFPNLKEQEDMVFIIHCCMKATNTSFINRIIVHSDIRDDSLSRTMNSTNVKCCLDVFGSIENLLKSKGILETFRAEFDCYKMRTSSYILLMTISRVRDIDEFLKGVKIIKDSGSLSPRLSVAMVRSLKVSTIAGIMISKFSLLLRILRLFKQFKIIKGY